MAGWPDVEFDAFVASRTPALLRFGYALTGDLERAEEVVQAGLRAAYRRSRRRVPEDPEADVRRAVVAAALRRRRRADEPVADVASDGHPPDPGQPLPLAGLSRRQRAVLVLRRHEGWSDEQVAEACGLTPGAVASVLARTGGGPVDLDEAVRLPGAVQALPGAGARLRAGALRRRRGRLLGAAAAVCVLLVAAGLVAAGSGSVDPDRPPAGDARPTEAPRVVDDRRILATPVRLRPVEAAYDTCPAASTALLAAEGGGCYDLALAALTLYEVREVSSGPAPDGPSTAVRIRMTQADAEAFEHLTRERVGQPLAVVVDGLVYAAPVVAEPVTGGELELRLGPAASSVLVRALGV